MTAPAIRDRSEQSAPLKKVENIAPEEITEALKNIVKNSFSISIEEASKVAMDLFGIKRLTGGSAKCIKTIIDQNVKDGVFVLNDNFLSISS